MDVIILANVGYFQLALRVLGLPGNNVPGSLHDCILILAVFVGMPPLALRVLGLLGKNVPGSLQEYLNSYQCSLALRVLGLPKGSLQEYVSFG